MKAYLRDLAEAQRAVEFLQEAQDLLRRHDDLGTEDAQMELLHENLGFLRSFLTWIQENSNDHEDLQALVKHIRDSASQLLDAANSCIYSVLDREEQDLLQILFDQRYPRSGWSFSKCSLRFDILVRQIKSFEDVIKGFVFSDHQITATAVREWFNLPEESDTYISLGTEMIGLNDETQEQLDRLMGNKRQLEVISITGMAGIGKTTLAQRLYNDQSVVNHFSIRGWVSVSQVYHETKLLSSILSCIPGQKDLLSSINDQDIGERLFRCLKGNIFLIVIDDIWDIGVWNDIKIYFPNDGNGSRILVTSRIADVASNASNNPPHRLRFLNPEESWLLFQRKAFSNKSCPLDLMETGKKIVEKCKGLPLAIVVVAGLLLKKEKTHDVWSHVAENIGPFIDSNQEQIIDILALSYEHLPEHLKLCFLYLGTFSEDHEIPVKKLIWSWIAEGYIKETKEKELEDLAEDYLMELISRSLVIAAKQRSAGGPKTCHIHDMVRELCIRKVLEKKLMMPPSCSNREFRLGCFEDEDNVEGGTSTSTSANMQISFGINFLRVLDLRETTCDEFPMEILRLFHLKYLALQVAHIRNLPGKLYMLCNLETFILQHREKDQRIKMPFEIWKMQKLRRIDISSELEFEDVPRVWLEDGSCFQCACFIAMYLSPIPCSDHLFDHPVLPHLRTISHLCPSRSVKKILARTPALKKLRFHLTFSKERGQFFFPDLSSLKLLESVKFEYQTLGMKSIELPHLYEFPPRLRKLTLVGSHVNWEQMSILGMLPNLEVLKIKDNFFSGPKWETRDDGFRCLRFLKLSHMDLEEWVTYEYHFPKLEQLVLNACLDLVEIPSAFVDFHTMQAIQVYRSSSSAGNSALRIQESQRDLGNDLKVFIYPHFEENISV